MLKLKNNNPNKFVKHCFTMLRQHVDATKPNSYAELLHDVLSNLRYRSDFDIMTDEDVFANYKKYSKDIEMYLFNSNAEISKKNITDYYIGTMSYCMDRIIMESQEYNNIL